MNPFSKSFELSKAMKSFSILVFLLVVALSTAVQNVMESSTTFWNGKAQNDVKAKIDKALNTNKAKNVVLFLGDGMSIPTVTATRIYLNKEEGELSFEKFPHYGLAQTYCIDKQVADSACTATAYLSGIKANYRTINVNGKVKSDQCVVPEEDHVYSIAEWAQKACKATGLVTTTTVTHASPAGVYANIPHRFWEDNAALDAACGDVEGTNVKDIAYQLIHGEVGKNLKVIMGGGRNHMINKTEIDEEGEAGFRTDGRNLINEWLADRNQAKVGKYVWHKQQLDEINIAKTDYLLGLFEGGNTLYSLDINNNNLQHQEPSLTDMTVAAIKMLQKEENGFFLFVEGGKIDHAHHDNNPYKALEETKEFARAIEAARQMTNEADTLIVVTSDHSHAMSFSGTSERGNNILGLSNYKSDQDGFPYETLSYANGPGYAGTYVNGTRNRVDRSEFDMKNPERQTVSTSSLSSETHAGDDVGVYASGPWSHLFAGSYGQNNIPVLMAYAAQIGTFNEENETCSGSKYFVSIVVTIFGIIVTIL